MSTANGNGRPPVEEPAAEARDFDTAEDFFASTYNGVLRVAQRQPLAAAEAGVAALWTIGFALSKLADRMGSVAEALHRNAAAEEDRNRVYRQSLLGTVDFDGEGTPDEMIR